ncbi:MAG: hypothetical protein HWD59_13455 [Coxiellaceae bacterium]|nr:MAG: hypothetical protein HWD59_13455 [Coxiellaceae bacterium]
MTSLIILSVLTLLILGSFQISILQTKMAGQWLAKAEAFNAAETALLQAESQLDGELAEAEGGNENSHYSYQRLLSTDCPDDCYQVTAIGQSGMARSVLSAIYSVVRQTGMPGNTIIQRIRLTWQEVE